MVLELNYLLIDFIILAVRLFALEFCKDATAQNAAGIQPITVNCKTRQIMPVRIFPLSIKDINGNKMAINVIVIVF